MRLTMALIIAGLLVSRIAGVSYAQYDYRTRPSPAQAQAADVKTQVKTAITHAGFAAGGNALNSVEQHLGHALNCIEGAKGKNFNQAWGHVCEGQGNGILVDLKAASGGADFMLLAETADNLAVAGIKTRNLAAARLVARGVAALLTIIADNLK